MRGDLYQAETFEGGPDYDYGNESPIEVIRISPFVTKAIDPHASLDNQAGIAESAPFTEAELEQKVEEIAANYHIIGDPNSAENDPKQFGITVANAHLLGQGEPAVLVMSTQGSNLYDEEGNPNNEGNALELAYTAFKYPDKPIVYAESPGTGNSTDLTGDEYGEAAKDGKLVHETTDSFGKITNSQAFETLRALSRALAHEGIDVSHMTSNASGAHFASALATELPKVERMFFYNATNISDRHPAALTILGLKEILTQSKYEKRSKDPLQLTAERKEMARRALGSVQKSRIAQARSSTFSPVKMWRQQRIFSRGQAAAVHTAAAHVRNPKSRITHVFPEFAAHYKRPEDFKRFMQQTKKLGGATISMSDVESLKIPLGQYGHSHYPSVRQTLEGYGFNR